MGDYTEIWGIHSSVVYDNSKAYRIYWTNILFTIRKG
jgi:hypothetical protein